MSRPRNNLYGAIIYILLMIMGSWAGKMTVQTNRLILCDKAFEEGNHQCSGTIARELLIADPQSSAAAWRLSRALIVTSNLETSKKRRIIILQQAMDLAELAIAENPDSSRGHTCLAICRGNMSNLVGGRKKIELAKGARASAEEAVRLDSDNFMACLVLGVWHREMATLSGVTKVVAKIVYGGLPAGASLEESEKQLHRATVLAPDRINPHKELGITLMALKRYAEAAKAFEKAVSLPVKCPDDAVYLKEAHRQLKKVRRKLK